MSDDDATRMAEAEFNSGRADGRSGDPLRPDACDDYRAGHKKGVAEREAAGEPAEEAMPAGGDRLATAPRTIPPAAPNKRELEEKRKARVMANMNVQIRLSRLDTGRKPVRARNKSGTDIKSRRTRKD